jgi:hypothetical protein
MIYHFNDRGHKALPGITGKCPFQPFGRSRFGPLGAWRHRRLPKQKRRKNNHETHEKHENTENFVYFRAFSWLSFFLHRKMRIAGDNSALLDRKIRQDNMKRHNRKESTFIKDEEDLWIHWREDYM